MKESALKEELARLKEKLSKKNQRVKELIRKNQELEKLKDHAWKCQQEIREKYYAIQKNFPQKYYRVTWSGLNEFMKRNPEKVELRTGVCASQVIESIKNRYTEAIIHMIEEVAT